MKTISIVVPVYYNEANLPETVPQLLALRKDFPDYRIELVFVDDGSGDRSLDILLDFQSNSPKTIKVVKLTRNFGAMAAVQAGLEAATGDCVGVIAADLQDPPDLFVEMVRHWESGIKVVLAVRQDRHDGFWQKRFSNTFWWLVRKFAIPDYPRGGFDLLLIDRQVAQHLNEIQEKNTNPLSLAFWLGFRPVLVPYVRRRRTSGRSRWTLSKKIKLIVDTFVGFSYLPVRLFSVLGFLVAASAFLYGVIVLAYRIAFGAQVQGFTATVLIISLVSGVQMAMLGVLGEYVWRVLDEVRRRPPYVIDQIYDNAGAVPSRQVSVPEAPPQQNPAGAGIPRGANYLRTDLAVGGAALYQLPLVLDLRGHLSYAQYAEVLPFAPLRYFLVFNVPSREVRGEHAHRKCGQFLVCAKGSCAVVVDDGKFRAEVRLERPDLGLYVPAMVWAAEYDFSRDAVLMVLASHEYQASDYIRSYDEFLGAIAQR